LLDDTGHKLQQCTTATSTTTTATATTSVAASAKITAANRKLSIARPQRLANKNDTIDKSVQIFNPF